MENKKDVKRLEVILAIILMFVADILAFIEGYYRESISDYAYSEYSYIFNMLLTIAAMMFIYNGVGYKRHWYNAILGASLLGVVLTPHLDFKILHYTFASIFFLGSIASISLSSNIAFRGFKFIISGIALGAILSHVIWGSFTILEVERIGIIPFAIHFIVKSYSIEIKKILQNFFNFFSKK